MGVVQSQAKNRPSSYSSLVSAESYPDAKSVRGTSLVCSWFLGEEGSAGQVTSSEGVILSPARLSTNVHFCLSLIFPQFRVTPERRCTLHNFSMSTTHPDLEGGNNPGMCYITRRFDLSSLIS